MTSDLPFSAVNRSGAPDHDPGLQKHHLLPLMLLKRPTFDRVFDTVGIARAGFHDFRRNGMLLPCREDAVLRLGLPLHRGPHPRYSELVWQRVGQIERDWTAACDPGMGLEHAHMRLSLLQRALRRRLLAPVPRLQLNMRDPLGSGRDFSEIDRMAELLWQATAA